MMITGKTKTVGIIGWPIEHSWSPIMHNAAFKSLNLDFVYIPLPVSSTNLKEAVAGLKSMGFVGANVTIPHKVSIMQYLDDIEETALQIGAVNTVVIRNGKSIGYNTDAGGFIKSLQQHQLLISGKKAVVLGAGGGARAVICGLMAHDVGEVAIASRNYSKAKHFAQSFTYTNNNISAYDWYEADFSRTLQNCDLLINCTPVGMSNHKGSDSLPIVWEQLSPNAVVCDIIYTPPITPFLNAAQHHGHMIVNGVGMLAEQGLLSFELWTGQSVSREIFYEIINKKANF